MEEYVKLKQTCPRRLDEFGPWKHKEDLDTYSYRTQMSNGIEAYHCDFCGSLHPDNFMNLCESSNVELEGTDKNYKVYINVEGKRSKFYFRHLSIEQQKRFIEIYNTNKLGKPFYRLPFFMSIKQKEKV